LFVGWALVALPAGFDEGPVAASCSPFADEAAAGVVPSSSSHRCHLVRTY